MTDTLKDAVEKQLISAVEKMEDADVLCLMGFHVWRYFTKQHPMATERAPLESLPVKRCKHCSKLEADMG